MNFKELRKRKLLTQAEVAEYLQITPQAYANYERGDRTPDIRTCKKLAILYGVSLDTLLNDKDIKTSSGVKIPVLGTIPAGTPIEAVEDILDYEEITEEMARNGNYFALKVKGDSMSPTINNGDIVIVKQREDAESGKICVVMINGFDATLKEIKKDLNGIWILPHNPYSDFKPTFYTNKEILELPIKILGVAVEIRRTLK